MEPWTSAAPAPGFLEQPETLTGRPIASSQKARDLNLDPQGLDSVLYPPHPTGRDTGSESWLHHALGSLVLG